MGVFKNDVGRPSNKTITIRNILKGILVIILAAIIFAGGYALNGYQKKEDNKTVNKKVVTTKNKINKFDKKQVELKNPDDDSYPETIYDVYVYGKKMEYNASTIDSISVIDDIAVIDLGFIDSNYLLVVNTKGEELMHTDGDMLYCADYKSSECYGYKIKGNSFTFYTDDLGNDDKGACLKDNEVVLSEIEMTYENGKLSSKTLSSITGQEYVKKHNIDCSNNN